MKNQKNKAGKIDADSRIWLTIDNKSFLGQGKIELLEKIKEYGSLRKAAGEMKMSYRKAWGSINKINELAGKPLVILKRGGKDGGIAEITEVGEKAIIIFNQLQEEIKNLLEKQTNSLEL
ncbi:MAG: LysR family transcriptional regulator [Bacteroidales bacterium]|nr:LysR family transcriptional regulator [Bacteroidales bacterium]